MPAQAHTSLLSSDPSDGARLDAAPQQIVLTFTESLNEPSEASVVVDGTTHDATVQIDGPRLLVEPSGEQPDGAYEINYRVVSADGHPITGTLAFTVGDVAAPADNTTDPAPAAGDGTDWLTPVAVGVLILGGVVLVVLLQRRSRSGSADHDRS